MVVISRKKNETVLINEKIAIVVVDIRVDKIRLGIDAPVTFPAHRHEVYQAIRRYQSRQPEHSDYVAEIAAESQLKSAASAALQTLRPVGENELDRLLEEAESSSNRRPTQLLVLSRKENDAIIIHDFIAVLVMGILDNEVRLGIQAPKGSRVHLSEIFEAGNKNV